LTDENANGKAEGSPCQQRSKAFDSIHTLNHAAHSAWAQGGVA
jgi:hypothetical protein